jgi:hypothetical protein
MEFVIGAVLLLLVLLFFLRIRKITSVVAEQTPADSPQAIAEDANQVLSQQPVSSQQDVGQETIPLTVPAPAVPETPHQNLPQDSVLRRHHLTHIRHMIESVTVPRPTESVLRRHYDQLIASELDSCLSADAHMQKLIDRYEAHRKSG